MPKHQQHSNTDNLVNPSLAATVLSSINRARKAAENRVVKGCQVSGKLLGQFLKTANFEIVFNSAKKQMYLSNREKVKKVEKEYKRRVGKNKRGKNARTL